jgi:hypothetical protein
MPYVPRSKAQIYAAFAGATQNKVLSSLRGHLDGQWKSMVNEYRSCHLTFEKDRAIAFAGIARAVQAQTNMTYLAGIWKEAAHLDLLWSAIPRGPKSKLNLPGPETRAQLSKMPSWSWFSVACQMSQDHDVIDFSISTMTALKSKETVYHASILSFEHPKLPAEPEALLYDFEGLSIKLSTYIIPAGLRWEESGGRFVQLMPNREPMLPKKLSQFPLYDPTTAMQCNLDDLSLDVTDELPTNASMILLVFIAYHENRKGVKHITRYPNPVPEDTDDLSDWWTRYQFSGLVVVPHEENSASNDGGSGPSWKRVGVYTFSVEAPSQHVDVVLPFDIGSEKPEEVWMK